MQAKVFNADDGSIDRHPVDGVEFAKDVARALVATPGSAVYRVQLVDPMRGDWVLWDTYVEELDAVAREAATAAIEAAA